MSARTVTGKRPKDPSIIGRKPNGVKHFMPDQGVDYEAVLADLEGKKSQLEAVISGIKSLLATGVVGVTSVPTRVGDGAPIELGQIAGDAFFGMSIPDAAKKLLDSLRRPMSLQALSDALL